ncbi:MAG: GCN5-related N-acetyltransferase [Frankiales bacterium]|nr:GCN5-related N-acetyltransferase [Frankiales bacterium]
MKTSVLTVRQVTDRADLELVHAVDTAAYDHDFLALPVGPIEERLPGLGGTEIAGSRTYRYLALEDATPVATLSIEVFTKDNLQAAALDGAVHPDHRRRGHGRELTAWAVEETTRLGRSILWFQAPAPLQGGDGPGEPMLRAVGAQRVLDESRRLLDLRSTDLLPPAPVAEGYRAEQWLDRTPDHLVDGVAYLQGRMSTDAPFGGMTLEPEAWDAARVREKEVHAAEVGRLHVVTVVVHEESGEVAGLTEIGISRARPEVSYQWETIVDPAHRGHRLGLALKTWNHQLLAASSPQTRWVNTWNADSNSFMISVNEECGFRQAERWLQYELRL